MSNIAEVIVFARYSDEVMAPLTQPDDSRSWTGWFEPIPRVEAWMIEFFRIRSRSGLLRDPESLAWPHPESVQVLIHDQEDDCFGLWMMREGVLTELPLPGHTRFHAPAPSTDELPPHPGFLWRTETDLPAGFSTERQDPRPAW